MTQLRQQMIRAMDLKNLSDQSQRSYLSAVSSLARHYGQSPETISETMIEDWLLYLKNKKGYSPGSCCTALSGVRFFYTHVLDKQIEVGFALSKKPRKLPCVLTKKQVGKIIYGPKNLKHRLMLMTTYSADLYRCRWQVELFFKWIKQHLRIKAFYGTSENAVKTQIWIAISVYVLVAIIKKRSKIELSLYTILQILSLTLFEKIP